MYKIKSTITLDFSDLGEDQNNKPFFVEIKNPKFLSYSDKNVKAAIIQPYVKDDILEISKESIKALGTWGASFIVNWNLLDMDTEHPIDFKQEDALDHIPSEIVERIFAVFNETDEETKNS